MGSQAASTSAGGARAEFERKRDAALVMLDRAGIDPVQAGPLPYRMRWRTGIRIAPPHLANPLGAFVVQGLFFGTAGGVMVFGGQALSSQAITHREVFPVVTLAVTIGLCSAVYYAWSARKHRVPRWREFEPAG